MKFRTRSRRAPASPVWNVGLTLEVNEVDSQVTLVLTDPQHRYVFRPVR